MAYRHTIGLAACTLDPSVPRASRSNLHSTTGSMNQTSRAEHHPILSISIDTEGNQ